jgi:hypothetical protein
VDRYAAVAKVPGNRLICKEKPGLASGSSFRYGLRISYEVPGQFVSVSCEVCSMTFPQEFGRRISPSRSLSSLAVTPDVLGRLQSVVDGIGASAPATILFLSGRRADSALAAEAVAYEMGRDLVRIDLAAVVSKYIGETEKNLDRLLGAVDPQRSILFFDEADALFGKRSEVKDSHDRYANLEARYLLQRLEQFGGVAIFSTSSPVLRVPCKQECQAVDLAWSSK